MGKNLIAGGYRGGCFAGTWTRWRVRVRLREVGIALGVVAWSLVPLAGAASILTMSSLVAVGALFLRLLVAAMLDNPELF